MARITYSDGVTPGVSNTFDRLGRLIQINRFGDAYDDLGNRKTASSGGDELGLALRTSTYAANNLNQYTSRTVPGYLEILGAATNTATEDGAVVTGKLAATESARAAVEQQLAELQRKHAELQQQHSGQQQQLQGLQQQLQGLQQQYNGLLQQHTALQRGQAAHGRHPDAGEPGGGSGAGAPGGSATPGAPPPGDSTPAPTPPDPGRSI